MKFEFDPLGPGVPLRGQKVTLNGFLSHLKHTRQILLVKFFDLMKFDFEHPGTPRVPPGPQGSRVKFE